VQQSKTTNLMLGEVALRHKPDFEQSPIPVKQNEANCHFAYGECIRDEKYWMIMDIS